MLEGALSLEVVDVVGGTRDSLVGVVIYNSGLVITFHSSFIILTAPHLELTSLRVQGIIIKVHPAGDCDPHTELVGDCLVLVDPHSGHLLQHSLSAKCVEAVDLQLWIPDVFQNFRRLVHFLEIGYLSSINEIIQSRQIFRNKFFINSYFIVFL